MRRLFRKVLGESRSVAGTTKRARGALLLAVAPVGVVVLVWTLLPGSLASSAASFATMLTDPFRLMAMRSPGSRAPGALYSIKRERVAARSGRRSIPKLSSILPNERVLAVTRERPSLLEPVPADLFPSDPLGGIGPFALGGAGPGLTFPPVTPLSGANFPGLSPLALVPGGSDPGTSLVPITPAPPISPGGVTPDQPGGGSGGTTPGVSSPIPEPETWLTSIVGLFMVAAVVRRRMHRSVVPVGIT